MMDEMTWTDPQLKARYEENSRKLEHLRETLPNLYSEDTLPYKVFTRSSLHGIQNMRINWLMDNHPQRFREMMMANVLEEHLRDIERRTRERQAQIMDQLMESRHLLNRTDCLKAAPQMTDLDRLNGMNEAQSESMSMAIHEIVESF
ncbi:MAG: TnpV protein [Bifidobacterium adolescentis]